MPNENEESVRYRHVTEGEFVGWSYWPGDHYEVHSGPYYFRQEDGRVRCAFRVAQKHLNARQHHGGCLLTFAITASSPLPRRRWPARAASRLA